MAGNNGITIYIEKTWVTGDTCLFTVTDQFEHISSKHHVTKIRGEFVNKLKNEGFNVTFDKNDINEDTICLIMDDTALCSKGASVEEFKKMYDKKIAQSGGEYFYYPLSLKVKEYFENPFFPAVFKNELTNGGVDKFLIETPEQLEIIKNFYAKHYNNPEYKLAFDNTICQQLLENPGKYATYLRVLVGGTGEVLGASIKCSTRSVKTGNLNGLFERVFLTPGSPYFINAKKMFNYYSGGENITFSQPRYSTLKSSILVEHGFDPSNLQLPSTVLDVCENVMSRCNREIGVLCGFDFMLNESDGKWYYLENQAFPAIEEWAWARNITLPKSHDVKGYMKYLELELQTRYEALMMLVKKRENKDIQSLKKVDND